MAALKNKRDPNFFLAAIFLFSFIIMMSNDIYQGRLTVEDFIRSVLIGLFSVAVGVVVLSFRYKLKK